MATNMSTEPNMSVAPNMSTAPLMTPAPNASTPSGPMSVEAPMTAAPPGAVQTATVATAAPKPKPKDLPPISSPTSPVQTADDVSLLRNKISEEAKAIPDKLPLGQEHIAPGTTFNQQQKQMIEQYGLTTQDVSGLLAEFGEPQALETAITTLLQRQDRRAKELAAQRKQQQQAAPTPVTPTPATPTTIATQQQQAMQQEGPSRAEQAFEQYKDIAAGLEGLTDADRQAIAQAGEAAGAQFDPLIKRAQHEMRQGMAKGLVRGGQAGGLMSTQIAGVGAFAETVGGTFVGAGGLLDRQREEYSYNISQLESAKIQAMQQARAAKEAAILSGKKEDLAQAQTMFNMAVDLDNQQRQKQQDFLNTTLKLRQIAEAEMQEGMMKLDAVASAGMSFEDLPEQYVTEFEQQSGLPSGWTQSYFQTRDATLRAQSAEQEYKAAEQTIDLLDKLGAGGTITIGGNEYMYHGRKGEDFHTGTERDVNGNTFFWEVNKKTGERMVVPIGNFPTGEGWQTFKADNGEMWALNPKTGEYRPYGASEAQMTWESYFPSGANWSNLFPEGSQSPFRDESDPYQGQCAAFVNDICGEKLFGSTIQSKLAALSEFENDIGPDGLYDVATGDVFVTEAGSTGHIGFVAKAGIEPGTGRKYFTAMESNAKGDGKITHGKKYYVDQVKMIGRPPTPNLPPVGSDARRGGGILNLGGRQTIGNASSPSVVSYDGLSVQDQAKAKLAANRLFGSGGTADERAQNLQLVSALMQSGMSVDDIETEIKYSDRSKAFTGVWRDAAESIAPSFSAEWKRNQFMETLDGHLERGNNRAARDLIKKSAFETLPTAEGKKARGTDRGLQLLSEIEQDLISYERAGGDTNLFSGTKESVAKKVGAVKDPELRQVAQKIQAAVQRYRQDVSGAAFTESEAAEYRSMFPNENNTAQLNSAIISSLRDVWQGDLKYFMTYSMGEDAYNELFVSEPKATSGPVSSPPVGNIEIFDGYMWMWDGEAFNPIGSANQ